MAKQTTVAGGGDLKLNVLEWGNPKGFPILFIHGWSQSYLCWMKQIESSLIRDFRLVAFDNRGHGMSEAPAAEAAYTDSQLWADDINAIIRTLDLERPVLVGWSYGGLIMTDYLRAYGDQKIAGLNFVGATVRLNEEALGPLIGPGFFEPFPRATSSDLSESIDGIRDFMDRCFAVPLSREDHERALCWNMAVRPDVRASLAARDIVGDDALRSLSVPILVTQGRKDTMVLPSMAEHILKLCPTAKASWYEGVAHGPFIEAHERFNEELAAFVRSANA